MKKSRYHHSLTHLKDTAPSWQLWLLLLLLVTLFGFTACSFRTPSTSTPVPDSENSSSQGIEKSFFEEVVSENVMVQAAKYDEKGRQVSTAKYEKRSVRRPKTFLCGWAPINENGFLANYMFTHAVHMSGHCNLEFEVTESLLIGRLVNPSFPNDRNRWKQVLAIPISQHHYVEKAKDGYGRETNEIIENKSRSDWSSRPNMKLNLGGIRFMDENTGLFWDSRTGSVTNVSQVEWDKERGFLGFTIDATSPQFGSDYQARIRVNFLRFQHNEKFERTPYSSSNSRYLNALHILGEKVDGVKPVLYAAHWDLNKKHKVYLHGFPSEYVSIAKSVVDAWNKVFSKKLGLPAAFELDMTPVNKYGFDLRYPTMTWVQDALISEHSPLGVGMVLADVKNGEALWGGVTLYGGIIEQYIKGHLPGGSGGASSKGRMVQIPKLGPGFFSLPNALQFPIDPRMSADLFSGSQASLSKRIGESSMEQVQREAALNGLDLQKILAEANNSNTQASGGKPLSNEEENKAKEALIHRLQGLGSQSKQAASDIVTRAQNILKKGEEDTSGYFARQSLSQLLNVRSADPEETKKVLGDSHSQIPSDEAARALLTRAGTDLKNGSSSSVVFDLDRRAVDVIPGWQAALQANKDRISYEGALKTVIKELIIHEFGHFLGLGHQFKENILPPEGSVPEKIVSEYRLREKAKEDMTNATSVMGYKSPTTEVLEQVDDVMPGPQDVLVLRYLYKGEYATYRKGDDDFKFFKVPANGVIPAATIDEKESGKGEYPTAYFPQCNDFHASTSADPYCNRFDRGYNAETIVKSYLDELDANKITRLYAFTDARGGNTESLEAYLWGKSLTVMGRVRLFYDYMRQQYATELEALTSDDLYNFSKVCSGEEQGSMQLQKLFWTGTGSDRKETELGHLCRVNRLAVLGLSNFLVNPGPDRSRIDWDNNYAAASMTGGDAQVDYSRAFGTHSALSVLPLKISALNALTTPRPYFFWGPWMLPVPRFDDDKGLFSYSTLYPYEFTKAIASGVKENLTFSSGDRSQKPRMGLSVLSMGYFLAQQRASNDSKRYSRDYISRIRNQNNFRLSLVALLLKLKDRNGDRRVTHFETEIYDFRSDKPITGVEAYLLPNGKVIARAPGRNFLYPVTDFTFISDDSGYVLAYRADYDDKHDDVLSPHSAKTTFETLNKSVLDACLIGHQNGLASFFNSTKSPVEFPGFEAPKGVAADLELQLRFLQSVKANYELYYQQVEKTPSPPSRLVCEESLEGLAMILSTAALLNGYWIPEAADFIW